MAHGRSKKRTEMKAVHAKGPLEGIWDDEKEGYLNILADLQAQVKPKGVQDEILIDRLAMALVRSRRLDQIAKEGKDKSVIKNLYFTDLTIQQLSQKLGIDRRTRMKAEAAGDGPKKRGGRDLSFMSSGNGKKNGSGNGGPNLDLDRGRVDEKPHESPSDNREGTDPGRSSDVLPGDPREENS